MSPSLLFTAAMLGFILLAGIWWAVLTLLRRTLMPQIFISHRRADNDDNHIPSLLHQSLITKYGPKNVFLDVISIQEGDAYDVVLAGWLKQSNVVVAVIGRHWAGEQTDAKPRIMQTSGPMDWVRHEVEHGLNKSWLLVVRARKNEKDPKPIVPTYQANQLALWKPLEENSLADAKFLERVARTNTTINMTTSGEEYQKGLSQLYREIDKRNGWWNYLTIAGWQFAIPLLMLALLATGLTSGLALLRDRDALQTALADAKHQVSLLEPLEDSQYSMVTPEQALKDCALDELDKHINRIVIWKLKYGGPDTKPNPPTEWNLVFKFDNPANNGQNVYCYFSKSQYDAKGSVLKGIQLGETRLIIGRCHLDRSGRMSLHSAIAHKSD